MSLFLRSSSSSCSFSCSSSSFTSGFKRPFLKRCFTIGKFVLPTVQNEPFQHYPPNSPERDALRNALKKCRNEEIEIPCIVGGKEIKTGQVDTQVIPSDHKHVLCKYHKATPEVIKQAIQAAQEAKKTWEYLPMEERLAVFTKASWLLSKIRRYDVMAATMLGTGKTVWQAEIDAAVEMIDFWRFGAKFVEEMYGSQIHEHEKGVYNRLEYRPLEGFTCSITPFNFAAIGGNLPSIPAMVGNTVLWKPSSTAILSNYYLFKVLQEAGLPDGVINFIPASGSAISEHAIKHPDLAAICFTGSTAVFRQIWSTIGSNISKYKSYPRIVGETGGKNFHLVHSSADVDTVVNNTLRGAFEYQGQKCSATSRLYVPRSLWKGIKEKLIEEIKKIKIGQPEEFDTFMTAVIDGNAFKDITGYIEHAKNDKSCKIIVGGTSDSSKGYFISPTIIETTDPKTKTMREEIFGPVLTAYVYEDNKFEETLDLVDQTSEYALTGSIFARDRKVIEYVTRRLRYSAGNFYVNDKSTGSIVGQQPFGGSRGSGTNDKAGWATIFNRFVSLRSIKENFLPLSDWRYPHMKS